VSVAQKTVCDFCGKDVKGKPVVAQGKRKLPIMVKARTVEMGSWSSKDICRECLAKIEWED